ncbi:MAG: DUF1653 domain-containing protein [Burkholderiales bacterium]|nr:DUF1653 domain-containing protein [Burkholderiales bacterium]
MDLPVFLRDVPQAATETPPASPRSGAPEPELPALPTLARGRYRHYKGGEYEVLDVTWHSETREPMVLYRPLYGDSGLWVRPYAMFVEEVVVDGRRQPRFALLGDEVRTGN